MEEFEGLYFYNKICQFDYWCDGYLDGFEVVCYDYKELVDIYGVFLGVVFLVDFFYMGMDISIYKMDWKLVDYLDVLLVLKGYLFVYFIFGKFFILDFCCWMEEYFGIGNFFKGVGWFIFIVWMNYNFFYIDIMFYKDLLRVV